MLFTLVSISCNNWKFQVEMIDQSNRGFKFLFNKVIYVRSRVCLWIEVISKNAFQPFPQLVFPFRKSAAFQETQMVRKSWTLQNAKIRPYVDIILFFDSVHVLLVALFFVLVVSTLPSVQFLERIKKLFVSIAMMC